jgi:hypothetical protein
MNKQMVAQLLNAAAKASEDFSREDRPLNTSKESFTVCKIEPQETTAYVYFKKNTGKLAVAFFYHVNTRGGEWRYWFVRASDIVGMQQAAQILCEVERHNFPLNYNINVALEVEK